jgi:hypothetical protein
MSVGNAFNNQISNRNFLAPTGFKFILNRARKVCFFGNAANIPGISLGTANQSTYLKDIDIPGDKMTFQDFTLRFLVDENLENYMEIQNWMRGLGYPESLKEIYDLQKSGKYSDSASSKLMDIYSDGTLSVLTSKENPNFNIKFLDMFPVDLSTLQFDATDTSVDYFTAEVTFKYTIYNIVDNNGNPL